jgi:hypothetical protein
MEKGFPELLSWLPIFNGAGLRATSPGIVASALAQMGGWMGECFTQDMAGPVHPHFCFSSVPLSSLQVQALRFQV